MIPLDSLTIGFLMLDDSLGFPSLKIDKFGGFTNIIFLVFDRYEIHIQAFLYFTNGKLIIFQSSSPYNYFQKMYSNFIYKKHIPTNTFPKHQKHLHTTMVGAPFKKIEHFQFFRFSAMKNNDFKDVPIFVLVLFEVFW